MELERKALYNLLRMNKDQASQKEIKDWQIRNYRAESLDSIFKAIHELGANLDKERFISFSENCDSPEDLLELLTPEELDQEDEDHLYLLIFELWRRLIPERPSLSIFCDELDEEIYLYDQGKLSDDEPIYNALNNLLEVLDEEIDKGADPIALFELVSSHSANDLESFLYDYIAEKVDVEEFDFANELLEGFYPFVKGKTWFDFLGARIAANSDPEYANRVIQGLIDEQSDDLELNLEILQFLAHFGDHHLFYSLAEKTLSLIETEDEFQDLLSITRDYFGCLDRDLEEGKIQKLLNQRKNRAHDARLNDQDTDVALIKALFSKNRFS